MYHCYDKCLRMGLALRLPNSGFTPRYALQLADPCPFRKERPKVELIIKAVEYMEDTWRTVEYMEDYPRP